MYLICNFNQSSILVNFISLKLPNWTPFDKMFGTFRDKLKETGTSYKGGSEEKVDAKGQLINFSAILDSWILVLDCCNPWLQGKPYWSARSRVCNLYWTQHHLMVLFSTGICLGALVIPLGYYFALRWPASLCPPWTWPLWPRWWWRWPWARGRSS